MKFHQLCVGTWGGGTGAVVAAVGVHAGQQAAARRHTPEINIQESEQFKCSP